MSKLFSVHSSYSRDWFKVVKYSLVKGLGTQYRDVSENEVLHFMVLSVLVPELSNRGVSGVVWWIKMTATGSNFNKRRRPRCTLTHQTRGVASFSQLHAICIP